ncbi:hypothetical protein EDB86DRAFT_2907076, partial [Lactarius hatsudake]
MIPSLSPSLSFPLPILTAAHCCCDHGWGFFVMPAVFTIGVVSRQPLLLLLLPIPLLQSLRWGRCCLGTATGYHCRCHCRHCRASPSAAAIVFV